MGAVDGKVAVKVGSSNAQSVESFALAGSGPAVSKMEPASGAPGTRVVLTGSGFASAPTDNVVRFNGGMLGELAEVTATSVTVKVPEGATTGRVQVETPDGIATVPSDFEITAGSDDGTFETTVRTSVTDDNPPTAAVTTPGRRAQVLFDAEQGDDIGFGVTASTFNSTVTLVVRPARRPGGEQRLCAGGRWKLAGPRPGPDRNVFPGGRSGTGQHRCGHGDGVQSFRRCAGPGGADR
ncbi:IPT/TIG domain-containing protein [Streptomyces sp. NBC_01362]|uniref:IPT/TIG domain-containing protein n=1 Tax=Streptomyces sp. NBC_01362 TaxID=2903839 RepID=UPI002E30D996|nr:IPT/TIG domain-containing protein [Streptomyces sp. NBC_01362]